jgi:NitT/TauT family transport system permease protein
MYRFVAFTSLGRKALPNQFDLFAFALIFAILIAVVHASHGVLQPLSAPGATDISLSYAYLPYYALRTTLRMFIALFFSLVFTFTYATLAAKSERAERILIPILDVLQSVPILGFLAFLVVFFVNLFPGSVAGYEAAAIFAIFTSQAWNMAFSFYQSLRSVPADLIEVANGFNLSPWQRFWQLETPFAVPGLVWNMMMSMSGGWFFVVASEAISVGDNSTKLPGIGSYIDLANSKSDYGAIVAAVAMMAVVILAYDQLLFRPLVAFAERFRVELVASQTQERSWVVDFFVRTRWLRPLVLIPARAFQRMALLRLAAPKRRPGARRTADMQPNSRLGDVAFYLAVVLVAACSVGLIVHYVATALSWGDLGNVLLLTTYTMVRVFVMIILASLLWVPIGIWIGLRPKLASRLQPLAQFLAAFPANVVFPLAVLLLVAFNLNPNIWLSILIVFGTQWYILFNVIAGAQAYPNDLKEAARSFGIRGLDWWIKVMIPGIFPYYVTGALTASGGSWNAAIVAEYVKAGDHTEVAKGIGSYIAIATDKGDFHQIVLGVAVMSVFVILFNRLLWRPLFGLAEKRLHLS